MAERFGPKLMQQGEVAVSKARQELTPPEELVAPPRTNMVGWYDPNHLLATGWQVLASSVFGSYADQRLVRAAVAGPAAFFDCTRPKVTAVNLPSDSSRLLRQSPHRRAEALQAAKASHSEVQLAGPEPKEHREFWFDYVSDVGDGWDPTYAVAYELAKDDLLDGDIEVPKGGLRRSSLMIFGGDQAYPAATLQEYEARLAGPYEQAARALAAKKPPPRPAHDSLFAIPGNHDWYDGLAAFTQTFCVQQPFAGRATHQTRSYFALKLPHQWWLFGVDLQLGTQIDEPQLEYFRKVSTFFAPNDRVILCLPMPLWVYGRKYDRLFERNLIRLEEEILKDKIKVWLAGDLHHYRRHDWPDGKVRITAGGGGAFLHPTHDHDGSDPKAGITVAKQYPEPSVTRKLCWLNLLFIVANPLFGFITGCVYLLLAIGLFAGEIRSGELALDRPTHAFVAKLESVAVHPLPFLFWTGLLLGGFILYTQSRNWYFRVLGGGLHGLLHYLAAFLLTLLGSWLAGRLRFGKTAIPYDEPGEYWFGMLVVLLGGWVVSSIIMGVYLLVALNVFRRHSTEAFSALRIKDWKNFLRLHINDKGELTIYAVGLRRVGRTAFSKEPHPDPKNEVELIEPVPVS